jgi:pSer/pThr/pTyr-binding forkhead associated (FHA) protein
MPRLVIRKGEGVGKDHALGSPCVVGRHTSANFVLGDDLASRNHFRIVHEGGNWVVEDLGSTNGTLLNGKRVMREVLRDGDHIVAGTTDLEFVQKDLLGSAPRPAPAVASPTLTPVAAPAVPAPSTRPSPSMPAAAVPAPAVPAARPAPAVPAARPQPAAPAAPAAVPARPAPALAPKPTAGPVPRPATAPATPAAAPEKPRPQAPIPTKKRR